MGVKQESGGETSQYFLALNVNISKTVCGTSKVTILIGSRICGMRFRFTPRSMTLDDLDLL